MRSPLGASAELLRRVRSGEMVAVTGVALALEYEAICRRPEHRMSWGLTLAEVDTFICALIAMMKPVRSHFLWRPQLRDSNDEMVLEAAINGRVQMIVTFHTKDFEAAADFGIDVLLPGNALKRLIQ